MLIYKLLKDKGEELQYFNRISKQQGFVGIVSKSITEFKKYNISEEIFIEKESQIDNKDLKEKVNDLASIYKIFNENLHKGYIDSEDILSILAKKLKECELYNDAEIWVDEFTTFTPQQLEVLKVLAKQCKNINITLCSDGQIQFTEGETDIFDVIKNTENRLLKMMQENNIAYKAARMMLESQPVRGGVSISLQKRIPVAAGYGWRQRRCSSCIICDEPNLLYGLYIRRIDGFWT